jgi:hypothetical protein
VWQSAGQIQSFACCHVRVDCGVPGDQGWLGLDASFCGAPQTVQNWGEISTLTPLLDTLYVCALNTQGISFPQIIIACGHVNVYMSTYELAGRASERRGGEGIFCAIESDAIDFNLLS